MEKLKCSFTGLGRIASLLEDDPLREKPCTHAGAVSLNPGCMIAGGSDTSEERRRLFSRRWNCPVFADTGTMLEETKPDIYFIATHPDTHLEMVEKGITHGVRVIVCEKPAADTLERARRIASFHRRGIAKIIINHERRYSQDYIEAKKHIEQKTFGKLLSVNSFLYMGRRKRIKDVLWHDGTHMADIIMYLTGNRMRNQKTQGDIMKRRGTVLITAESRGALINFQAGAGRDHLVFSFELSFENGLIRIGNGIYEIQESCESPFYRGFNSLKSRGNTLFEKTGYFENMLKDAVKAVLEPDYNPVSTAIDGYLAVKFLSRL